MALNPGTRLGAYEIVSAIGAGGFGEVYKARDTRLDRNVAIKVLPAYLSARQDLRERFEREARTVSMLNHRHICVLHDIGVQNNVHFLVMEYGLPTLSTNPNRLRFMCKVFRFPEPSFRSRLAAGTNPAGGATGKSCSFFPRQRS